MRELVREGREKESKDKEEEGKEGEIGMPRSDGLRSMQFSRGSIKALGAISGCLNKAIVAHNVSPLPSYLCLPACLPTYPSSWPSVPLSPRFYLRI